MTGQATGKGSTLFTTLKAGYLLIFLGIVGVIAIACGTDAPVGSVWNQIREYDPAATRGDEVLQPFFEVTGERMAVFGEGIEVFLFDSNEDAEAASDGVSKTASSIVSTDGSISSPLWVAQPHFYLRGNAIVIYVGENVAITGLLEEIGAEKFAEGVARVGGLPPLPGDPEPPGAGVDSVEKERRELNEAIHAVGADLADELDEDCIKLLEELSTGDGIESGISRTPTPIVPRTVPNLGPESSPNDPAGSPIQLPAVLSPLPPPLIHPCAISPPPKDE